MSTEQLTAALAEARAALVQLTRFAEYAQYGLSEDEHTHFEQFPCKQCAQKEQERGQSAIARIDALEQPQPRLMQDAPGEPPHMEDAFCKQHHCQPFDPMRTFVPEPAPRPRRMQHNPSVQECGCGSHWGEHDEAVGCYGHGCVPVGGENA